MKKKLFAVTTALLILLSGCGKKSESDYSLRDAIMKNQENFMNMCSALVRSGFLPRTMQTDGDWMWLQI